ncbi:unnamed protein product [Trichobilharzia regenti]|nr:unnamed protein product [Trichobilharzia regenti]
MRFLQFCKDLTQKTKTNIQNKLKSSNDDRNRVDIFPVNPDKYVTDLTNITLSTHQKEALSLGLKFCVPRKQSTDLAIHPEFENLYDQLKPLGATSDEHRSWFKAKMVDIAHQFLNNKPKKKSILNSQHFKALKELRENFNIIIMHSILFYYCEPCWL